MKTDVVKVIENASQSGVVYLLECKVCGKHFVGIKFVRFRARRDYYKSTSPRFFKGESVMKAELFRHFTEGNHHRFMDDISFR